MGSETTTYNLKEAARHAGMSTNALKAWIGKGKLQATPPPAPAEARGGPAEWVIAREDLDRFIAWHSASRRKVAQGSGELAAIVEELRVEVADLRRRLERIEARARRRERREAIADDLQGVAASVGLPTRSQGHSRLRPLPAGGIAWRTWADLHGIPRRTVEHAIHSGDLRVMRAADGERGWKQPSGQETRAIIDAAGQRRAWERWHDRDDFTPCSQCPHEVLAAREPVPTVKRPADRAEFGS